MDDKVILYALLKWQQHLPSHYRHTVLSRPNLALISHLSTKMWQMTASFISFCIEGCFILEGIPFIHYSICWEKSKNQSPLSFPIDKFTAIRTLKNYFMSFPQKGFNVFGHLAAYCRKFYCNKEMRYGYFGNFLKYVIGYCHFLVSFDTSRSFPYASNDFREANEMVIINDSIDRKSVV